jgi:hypothetical protein
MRLSSICTTGLRVGIAFTTIAVVPALVAEGPATTPAASSIFTMNTSVTSPTRDFLYQPEGVSTSDDTIAAGDPSSSLAGERDSLSFDGGQPPPGRRSYGRSRYQDRWHNSDGSSKIAFVAGAGMTVPVGNTGKYYTPNYAIQAGAGLNFNKMFGILGEFHYDASNLTPGAIQAQYNNYINFYDFDPASLVGLDGNSHVIALTVNPIINFTPGGGRRRGNKLGAYITGGVGYYHKTTNFTLPQVFNSFYGSFVQNSTFDSYSANSFGANGGFGLTYKLSDFSSERLFIEARYDWLKINANSNDLFPYNARNTEYVPITVGIRF